MEFEKFSAKVWKQGNSLVITIPVSIADYGGYAEGDVLKIMAKKEEEDVQKRKRGD